MKKVAIVLGTRPEAIKLIPVYLALKQSKQLQPILVSTGQHKEMLHQIFDFFQIEPDVDLQLMKSNQTLVELSSRLMLALGEVYQQHTPDVVIVQGDTTTALLAGLVAFYSKIAVCHVEAGLRTFDRFSPYPEEVNRRMIAVAADLHFAPTETAGDQLKQEKCDQVHVVGNTVVDSLFSALEINQGRKPSLEKQFHFLRSGHRLVLVTGHRRESFGEPFLNICKAISELSVKYPDLDFVYPVHLNPNVREPVHAVLGSSEHIHLIDPLPYGDMVYLMSQAHLIMTDSGGIQEEAPSLDVPVVVMRDTTERPEGISNGCAVLCGTDQARIMESVERILGSTEVWQKMSEAPNPYGDGSTSRQIVAIMEATFHT